MIPSIEVLIAVLSPKMRCSFIERFEPGWSTGLIEAVATRVLERIAGGREEGATASLLMNTTTQIKGCPSTGWQHEVSG